MSTRQFKKEADKLTTSLRTRIADLIDEVEGVDQFDKLTNVKKLVGFDNAYRVRIGDYRVGLFVDGDTVIFSRVLHRREIYRYFP